MKYFMGLMQSIFGIIAFGFVSLFLIIIIGIIITVEEIDQFKIVNEEVKIERRDGVNES